MINFSLEGTGTDQQLLLYENLGKQYEHDLVLLLPFLQNIRRNTVEVRAGYDPKTHATILRSKPRFDLINGKLVLRKLSALRDEGDTNREYTKEMLKQTDTYPGFISGLKARLNSVSGATALKQVLYATFPWEPFPEYRHPGTPEWKLMEAIIRRFKESAGEKPLVVVPVFYDSYVRFRMARNYWDRFASLNAAPGLFPIDLLPYFKRIGREGMRAFLGPYDCHFSAYGHIVVADALQSELTQLGLCPIRQETI